MNKVILTKPSYGYEGKYYFTVLGKGTRVIVPEGIAFCITQDDKTLLVGKGPKDFKLTKKTVPGLKTKLFKKELGKVKLYALRHKKEYLFKIINQSISKRNGIPDSTVESLKTLQFSIFLKVDVEDVDFNKILAWLKVKDSDFFTSFVLEETVVPSSFDFYLAKNKDYFVSKYVTDNKKKCVVFEHSKDANDITRGYEKYLEENFAAIGFKAKASCVGVFD